MTTFACEGGQSFTHGATLPLDVGPVEHLSSPGTLQEPHRLLQRSMTHLTHHLGEPVVDRVLDHRPNVQARPDLQVRSPTSCRPLDLLPKGSGDTAHIRCPAIGADEDVTGRLATRPHLAQE